MSAGAGTREVAWRLFAAEYEDASFSYSESDEERAPNYVVTPTGARVNRLFVVGVLTETEEVGDGVLRARVVDPTGAFVVYAGQYQPDAMAFLERATPPAFVAVTGKARTFQPEDSDVVYTSIRPESISEVDAETRDRWVVQTAEQTVDRVRTVAAALDRPERGDDLQAVLAQSGVDDGLASGIPVAFEEYGTTPGYLAAVRDLALDAVRVVADEREEAGELSLAPDEGGDVELGFDVQALADVAAATDASSSADTSSTASTDAEPDTSAPTADESASETESETEADPEPEPDAESEPEEPAAATATTGDESQSAEASDATATESEPESESEPETGSDSAATEPEPDTAEPEPEAAEETVASAADDADADGDAGPETDEMYEFDEEERAEIEENYDMGFSSGSDIPEQGDADIDVPEPDSEADADEQADAGESAPASDPESAAEPESESEAEPEPEGSEPEVETEPSEDEADDDDVETAQTADVDLEDAVMDTMQDLDDGSGADRAELVDTVTAEYGVTADDVEAAIQDALMSGRCYEPDDDTIVPI